MLYFGSLNSNAYCEITLSPLYPKDCDSDEDCKGNLICHQRRGYSEIPGCTGDGEQHNDYCHYSVLSTNDNNLKGLCEGNCDSDEDCVGTLVCQQPDDFANILGCQGEGEGDYCRYPSLMTIENNLPEGSYGLCEGVSFFVKN